MLNVAYKIFTNLLAKNIEPYTEQILGDYQCGFRKGRSTTDQIFSLRQIIEKFYEHNTPLHYLFVDFRQAFDNIDRSFIFEAMAEFGIPNKLINLTKMTLKVTNNQVKIQNKLTEQFSTHNGIRQGDSLSTLLFNIGLEKIIRNIELNPGGTIFSRSRQILGFADDVVLLARNTNNLEESLTQMQEIAIQAGLEINNNKTKYLNNAPANIANDIELNGARYEQVQNFKYLGSTVTANNEMIVEINEKLASGNRCLRALNKIITSRYISNKIKIRLYKTIIKPIVVYGSESWTLTEKAIARVSTWERKILRKIYGPTRENGVWRIRSNRELQALYNDIDIIADIKARRVEWLGHVYRMDTNRAPKVVLDAKLDSKRRRGRPKTRWINDVENDLRRTGNRNWRQKVMDRTEWRAVVREVKAKL